MSLVVTTSRRTSITSHHQKVAAAAQDTTGEATVALAAENQRLRVEVQGQREALERLRAENAALVSKERRRQRKHDKQLKKMTLNYQISRQILEQTCEVKLQYEWIIQQAMQVKECKRAIRKIIAREQENRTHQGNPEEQSQQSQQ